MKKFRNILAMLMVFVMLVAVMPMNVFAEPTGDQTPATFKITVNPSDNGSVTAEPTSAAKGATVTLTVNPADGYELDTLKVDGETTKNIEVTDAEGTDAEVTKTFTMPGEDVTVTATFKKTLNTLKKEAKEEVDKLANLSDDEKKPFNDAIDKATDKAGVDKAVADAKAKDAENKKAADDKAKEEEEKKKAEELAKAKEDAKKEINADNKLTEDQKKAAIKL